MARGRSGLPRDGSHAQKDRQQERCQLCAQAPISANNPLGRALLGLVGAGATSLLGSRVRRGATTGLAPADLLPYLEIYTRIVVQVSEELYEMAKSLIPTVAYLRTSSAANVGADKDSDKRQRAKRMHPRR